MENKPKLFMMCGLPASGKSTYAKQLSISEDALIVSSDSIREELWGDESTQGDNTLVFNTVHKRLIEGLQSNKNVIMDATNLNRKKRMAFLQSLNKINCEKICVFVLTPITDCFAQNSCRERIVPYNVIDKMYKNMNVPHITEGFDDVKIISNFEFENYGLFTMFSKLNNFNQHNPHHTLTVGEHCVKAYEYIINSSLHNEGGDRILAYSALLHDIGKPYTQVFENSKGEPTEEAHYFNHENVSAYLSLLYTESEGFNTEERLEIANYIQLHMQPFYLQNSIKGTQKLINRIGQERYNNLLLLHEADVNAR